MSGETMVMPALTAKAGVDDECEQTLLIDDAAQQPQQPVQPQAVKHGCLLKQAGEAKVNSISITGLLMAED